MSQQNRESRKAEFDKEYGSHEVKIIPAKEEYTKNIHERKELVGPYCRVSTMSGEQVESFEIQQKHYLAFLNHMSDDGDALLKAVVEDFAGFYEDRIAQGLPAEKKKCIFTKGSYTEKDVERLILSMPFKRFEDMGFMHHAKYLGTIQLDRSIVRKLTDADKNMLKQYCKRALDKYFGTDTEKK